MPNRQRSDRLADRHGLSTIGVMMSLIAVEPLQGTPSCLTATEVAVGQVHRNSPGPAARRLQLRDFAPAPTRTQQRLLRQFLSHIGLADIQRQGTNKLRVLGSTRRRRVSVQFVWSCHRVALIVPVAHHTHEPAVVCHSIFASTVRHPQHGASCPPAGEKA